MNNRVICLVGMSGSGKNYIADLMSKFLLNTVTINIGDLVTEYIRNCPKETSAADLKNNMDILHLLRSKIDYYIAVGKENIIVTGIRESYILKHIYFKYRGVSIAVYTAEPICTKRLEERGLTKEQIEKKTKEEVEIGVVDAMISCDVQIVNN